MKIELDIRNRLYLLVAGATLLLAAGSCTGEEADRTSPDNTLCPQGVALGTYGGGSSSRAEGGFSLLQEGTVGITRFSGGEVQDNLPYTYGTPWSALKEKVLLTGETSQLGAYYPYDGRTGGGIYSGTGGNALLSLSPCLYSRDKDLCAGTFEASAGNSRPVPVLQHLYARISFRFVKQFTYKGEGRVSKFSIDAYPLANYGLFSGNYTTAPFRDYIPFALDVMAGGTDDTADVLLVPDDLASAIDPNDGLPFTFVIDNPTPGKNDADYLYKGYIPLEIFDNGLFGVKAGWHYRLKILLGDGGFVIQGDGSFAPGIDGWHETTISGNYETEVEDELPAPGVDNWTDGTFNGAYVIELTD